MKLLFLLLFGLLSATLLLLPLAAASSADCITREYPQLDDAGNTLLVRQWCDGSYTWETIRRAMAAPVSDGSSAAQTVPAPVTTPATQSLSVTTRAVVVSPPAQP